MGVGMARLKLTFDREADMGHHIDRQGRFQSDKIHDPRPDRIARVFQTPASVARVGGTD